MRSDSQHSFPIKDTVMHAALIGVFILMVAVTVLVPDLMGVAA